MTKALRAIALIILGLFSQPAFSAGTIPVALVQQFDANGQPLIGCLLNLYVTGTVATPQLAYQDTALTQALPWPVPCDSNGRLPMFYVADGSIHPRLTDASGIVQFDYPSMLVIGPSGGSGGGGTVDPTTIASTGDTKFRPTSETLAGWVKLNGLTIGAAASGATGRANADTQALYTYLWTNCPDATCPVSTGRGATGLADFTANKTITLLDLRGRGLLGLCDMGSSDSGRLTGGLFVSGNCTTAQSTVGQAAHTLLQAELPNVSFTHSGITLGDPGHSHGLNDPGHDHGVNDPTHAHQYLGAAAVFRADGGLSTGGSGTSVTTSELTHITIQSHVTGMSVNNASTGMSISSQGSSASGGSGTALNVLDPAMLGTFYMKL